MGLLDGGIRAIFNSAFSGIYLPAEIGTIRTVPDGEGGNIGQSSFVPCRIQEDAITDQMRATGGYTENDSRFLILQDGVTQVNSDSRLRFNGTEYLLSNPTHDPAKSYWACRATPAGEYNGTDI